MSNVDYWQSPLPLSWLKNQRKLQKQIVDRERLLGMTPVLPAFSGHVPAELKRLYPDAAITQMSQWGGYDEKYRSHFIDPMDPLFGKIQKDIWRNRLNFMEQTIYMALTLLMKSILLIGMRTSYVLYQIKYSIRLSR